MSQRRVKPIDDRWLSVTEAADRVHKSKDAIYRWAREGIITFTAGMVSEQQLLAADRTKSLRSRRKARRHEMAAIVDGTHVGTLTYSPTTGNISGKVDMPMPAGATIELRPKGS